MRLRNHDLRSIDPQPPNDFPNLAPLGWTTTDPVLTSSNQPRNHLFLYSTASSNCICLCRTQPPKRGHDTGKRKDDRLATERLGRLGYYAHR